MRAIYFGHTLEFEGVDFLSLARACEGSNLGITGCPIICLGAGGSGAAAVRDGRGEN